MKCNSCGNETRINWGGAGAVLCKSCFDSGSRTAYTKSDRTKKCPNCKLLNVPGATYCSKCGNDIATVDTPTNRDTKESEADDLFGLVKFFIDGMRYMFYGSKSTFKVISVTIFTIYIFFLSPIKFPTGYDALFGNDYCDIEGCFRQSVTTRTEYFYRGKRKKSEARSIPVCYVHQLSGSGTFIHHVYDTPVVGKIIKIFLLAWGFILLPASIFLVNVFLIVAIGDFLRSRATYRDVLASFSLFFFANSILPLTAKYIFGYG